MNTVTRLRVLIVGVVLALTGTAFAEVPGAEAPASKHAKSAVHPDKDKDKDAKHMRHASAKKKPAEQATKQGAKKRAAKKGVAGKAGAKDTAPIQNENKGGNGP